MNWLRKLFSSEPAIPTQVGVYRMQRAPIVIAPQNPKPNIYPPPIETVPLESENVSNPSGLNYHDMSGAYNPMIVAVTGRGACFPAISGSVAVTGMQRFMPTFYSGMMAVTGYVTNSWVTVTGTCTTLCEHRRD